MKKEFELKLDTILKLVSFMDSKNIDNICGGHVSPSLKSFKFTTILNRKELEKISTAFLDAYGSSPEFNEFVSTRNNILAEVVNVVDGRLQTTSFGEFQIRDDVTEEQLTTVNAKVKELVIKYTDVIEADNKLSDARDDALTELHTVSLQEYKFSDIPDDLSSEDMELLFRLIVSE